ncbi:MAG: alpha/beta fold hydrolase [Limnohabitans sp.]
MIETWQEDLPHGITLSCRASGERGRPVLMFLHGFPEAAFVWDALLEHFARPEHGGYRCVAPNLRGYERSSAPTDVQAYRPKHLVQDIVALIERESGNAPLAALVAHDWGGAVAWNLANQHPRHLDKLVIINSPHPGTFLRELQHNPAQQAASAYMNFLIRPDAASLLASNGFARLFGFFENMGAASAPGTPGAPLGAGWLTEAQRARYRAVWAQGLDGGLNYYRASPLRPSSDSDRAAAAVTLPPEAVRVELPTLVLWAQEDVALLPALCEGLQDHVPQLRLVPLPQATHWVVHEQPQRVIAEIAGFLNTQ